MKSIILIFSLLLSFNAFAEEQLELFPEIAKSKEAMSLMEDLVDEMGEYFEEDAVFEDLDLKVVEINASEASAKLISLASDALVEAQEFSGDENDPFVDRFFKVVKISDGEVMGYVFGIHDSIDHPLWDGSGENFYYTFDYLFVDSVEWSG
ncbi:MAG: hypothetical protein HRT44_09550 [Bdellovibrionales bacterium]|nr:hypothetical protein [Bdellovibrionales bacterium]NQZ19484.1 hypothetical protein [Bdellovibrionales bacterium]